MTDTRHSHDQEEDGPTEQELIENFVAWVEAFVHDIESVPDDDNLRYWCPQWWNHPEAVTRLRALHEENIRAEDENTLSGWFVYHWDAHSKTLFSPIGPFEFCRSGRHFHGRADTYTPRLVTEAVPPDWAP